MKIATAQGHHLQNASHFVHGLTPLVMIPAYFKISYADGLAPYIGKLSAIMVLIRQNKSMG